jgi:hypothetical protein
MEHVHQNKNHTSFLILFTILRQGKMRTPVEFVPEPCRKKDKEKLDFHFPHKLYTFCSHFSFATIELEQKME